MSAHSIELWAGVECTVNRVGDTWFDQADRTGHGVRFGDLDKLAALGAKAVRYPVLWERTAPVDLHSPDWSWADGRLHRLRELGVRPIVGLVHHGSGPGYTSLLDEAFPAKLAAFARAVAKRYPWVEDFTPVNEPLTTARFSGLYGHWYPHRAEATAFARALVQQCSGIRLAMQAIRKVTPAARLVQTEDIGTVFSTPGLAYQAAFENERRWLSLDLLCGRVTEKHSMWPHLVKARIPRDLLTAFSDAPCVPDIVGINYYVTSDRFLDERLDRYPPHTHGGNGKHTYADVEAVRVCGDGVVGHASCLNVVWQRYKLPVALTEVHLACAREEQLRWLRDAWNGAHDARASGADVRAVTVWAAFGSVDWDSLLVRDNGHYEPGAYDVRTTGEPRPTALASLARELSQVGQGSHPVLAHPGWWQCDRRLVYPVVGALKKTHIGGGRPILIAGANGVLGRALARACQERGLEHRLLSRAEMDIVDPAAIARELERFNPWAVVNAAGYERIDEAQRQPSLCHRENATGPRTLAVACRARHISFATFSSDLVFDGTTGHPYVETDPVGPLGVYARSKAYAERTVLERYPDALVLRTSVLYGEAEDRSFVHRALEALRAGNPFWAARDLVVSPTYLPDVVHVTLDLLVDGERGLWHLTNGGAVTYADLALRAAEACGLVPRSLIHCAAKDLGYAAPRPPYSALASHRALLMPPLEDALVRFARAYGSLHEHPTTKTTNACAHDTRHRRAERHRGNISEISRAPS